jgi:hypothetical protein
MEESNTKVIGAVLYDITGMSKKHIQEVKDKINFDILNYEKISEYKNNQIPSSYECSCSFKDDDHGGIIKHFRD